MGFRRRTDTIEHYWCCCNNLRLVFAVHLLSSRVLIPLPGIALFTYHKYQKSLDTSIQLDAHGNPIGPNDVEGGGAYVELDQTDSHNISVPRRAESDLVSHSDDHPRRRC